MNNNTQNRAKGTWQIVQWCPDLVTREWINIGVGFNDGEYHFKWIDDFLKISEVYGLATAKRSKYVIELTIGFFENGFFDLSSQIKLIEVGFSQGESIEEILNRSFDRVVTFG